MLPNFKSKAFFAPMAGVSDPALRLVCKELGAGLVVTEFVNVHAVVAKNRLLKGRITEFIEFSEAERPVSVQIFGSDVDKLKEAVKIIDPYFDVIDYNMGCPAPHITKQMAGAALLQEEGLTRNIFRTLVKTSNKPVTVKIRAGVSKPDCYLKIAKIAEEEGVEMITLHARTLNQGYSGKADLSLIKKLKESVSIPVVGNGDVLTPEDAKRMLDETGCDYVMVGRGACKNPFIFTQINQFLQTGKYDEIDFAERVKYFLRYLNYTKDYKTIKLANIKMQAMNFTKGSVGGKHLRLALQEAKTRGEVMAIMEGAL